jgi:hypothetical protein
MTKVDELLKVKERNIDADAEVEGGSYDCLRPEPPKSKAKPDRKLERELLAELTMAERMEFERLCKARARACWESGDNLRKWLWGGW